MTTLIRATALTKFFVVCQKLGFNPQPLLRRLELSQAVLESSDRQIPVDTAITLLDEAARESGCRTFALRMAEERQLADLGPVALLLGHQRTLRDALQTIRQYRHLVNESLAMYIEETGNTVIIREEVVTDRTQASRQATELAVGTLCRLCRALLGNHWQPYSVSFCHAAPEDPLDQSTYRRLFGCKLNFGDEFNGLIFAASDLDRGNAVGDPVLARYAERFLETLPGVNEPSLVLNVRKAIYLLLPMGRATIEQVAQTQGLNVRTLQRRLDEAGEPFSALVNGVRRDLVRRYMENPRYSFGSIAEMLGYSTLSSFTRWFNVQFGQSPTNWRRLLREKALPAS